MLDTELIIYSYKDEYEYNFNVKITKQNENGINYDISNVDVDQLLGLITIENTWRSQKFQIKIDDKYQDFKLAAEPFRSNGDTKNILYRLCFVKC